MAAKTNPKVEFYFQKADKWKAEVKALRAIALSCKLTEELKWGHPCYSLEGSNVVLIHDFKEYCAFLFFKGALLKDPKGILIQQTRNVQAARQIRFTNARDIAKLASTLKSYIREAVDVEKSGAKVAFKKTREFPLVDEFRIRMQGMPALKTAFEALTPGRQRAYLLYFSSAKQSQTREARVEKCIPLILDGLGLDD